MQKRLQGSPRFCFPRRMPERRNQPVVGTDILRFSLDRVYCRSNSTINVAKQKARERQVGQDQGPRLVLGIEVQNGLQSRHRLCGTSGKEGDASQELVRDYSRGIKRNCPLHLF